MRTDVKKYTKLGILAVAILIIGGYAYFEMRDLLWGTEITVASPQHGETVTDDLVTVRGQAKHVASLSLNGRPIVIDPSGNFEEQLLLEEGYTIIELIGRDRFDRTVSEVLEIVYQPTDLVKTSFRGDYQPRN